MKAKRTMRTLNTLAVLTLALGACSPTAHTYSSDGALDGQALLDGSQSDGSQSDGSQSDASTMDGGTTDAQTPDSSVDAAVDGAVNAPLVFNIILRQTVQACSGCGIWFDWQGVQSQKPRLVVQYQHLGQPHTIEYQHGLNGMDNAHSLFTSPQNDGAKHSMLVKQAPERNGLFWADISDIPEAATIDEGFAYSDTTSVLAVHVCTTPWNWDYVTWTNYDNGLAWSQAGGDFGPLIREIRALEDLVNMGFSKANPNAWFDFTPYVQQIQAAR